jgi:hypothetical protein
MNGSLTGRELVNCKYERPSGRWRRETSTPDSAGLYSRPAARNASGEATLAFRLASSSGVISAMSTSARSGSPSADCTVTRPSASALASIETPLKKAAVANASAVARQVGFFMDVRAATAASAWHLLLIMRTNASRLDL